MTREDALALSRLYAVQLLSGLCGDFQAAADWLTDGGAGLSEEQQEVRDSSSGGALGRGDKHTSTALHLCAATALCHHAAARLAWCCGGADKGTCCLLLPCCSCCCWRSTKQRSWHKRNTSQCGHHRMQCRQHSSAHTHTCTTEHQQGQQQHSLTRATSAGRQTRPLQLDPSPALLPQPCRSWAPQSAAS